MDPYKYDFESRHDFIEFVKATCVQKQLIVKFSADWCIPCKKIEEYSVAQFNSFDSNQVCCIEVNIDDSFDIFAFLKQRKMIQGVPTLYLYRRGKDNYIPDESISGTDINDLNYFFNNV